MAPDEIPQLRAEVKRLRNDNEVLHARLDEHARDLQALKRLLAPEHLPGLVNEHVSAMRDLVAQLQRPSTRTATVLLPSGGTAKLNVTETRS
ncbi:MAG: hypothetical protein WCB10_17795 [Steroidobacteraceae bacterium]